MEHLCCGMNVFHMSFEHVIFCLLIVLKKLIHALQTLLNTYTLESVRDMVSSEMASLDRLCSSESLAEAAGAYAA